MALDAKTLFLPVLEEVNESAWREFESKYRAYNVRGGNEPMRSLLAPGVILLLEVYLPGEDLKAVSNEKLTEAFEGLYAPKNRTDTMARLKAIKMSANAAWAVGEVATYVSEFRAVVKRAVADALPSDKKLVQQFLSNLRPKGLQDELRLIDHQDVNAVAKAALEMAAKVSAVPGIAKLGDSASTPTPKSMEAVGTSGGRPTGAPAPGGPGGSKSVPTSGAPAPSGSRSGPPSVKTTASRKGAGPQGEIVCYLCGEKGHIRPECPKRAELGRGAGGTGVPRHQAKVSQHAEMASDDVTGRSEEDQPKVESSRQVVLPCPRVAVSLKDGEQHRDVEALLDTGANVNLVNSAIAATFADAPRRKVRATVETAEGKINVTEEVDLSVVVTMGMMRPTSIPIIVLCD